MGTREFTIKVSSGLEIQVMKNSFSILGVTLIVLLAALGCRKLEITYSQFPACVTPNGAKIGFGYGTRNFVIDGKSGKILQRFSRIAKHAALVCSAKNEVLAVYSDEIVNIETEQKSPRRIEGSTVIGISSNNSLIGYEGKKGGMKRGEELSLRVEKSNDQTDDLKLLKLSLEKLDAVKRNEKSFLTLPVKLIKNNELMVFAGGKTRTIPADENEEFGPDVWGFYRVGLSKGEISRTKAIDISDAAANLFTLPLVDATADGKIAAAAFSSTDSKIILVFDTGTGEEIFRQSFDETIETDQNLLKLTELRSIALSKDGTKIAIAGLLADYGRGRYKKDPKLFVYDLKTKALTSGFSIDDGTTAIVGFDSKEIIINFEGRAIVKLDANDGKEIWKTQMPKD